MNFNEKAYALGSKRSIIREIFEYSKKRAQEIGADNVFDFSLGNPSVEPPEEVGAALLQLLKDICLPRTFSITTDGHARRLKRTALRSIPPSPPSPMRSPAP